MKASRRAGLAPLIAAAFVAFTGGWIANPLLALVLAQRGASAGLIGVLAGLGWVSAMAASVCTARAIRLLGSPARVFRAGMAVAAVVAVLFARVTALWQFFLLEPVFSVALSLAWTSADIGVIALAPKGAVDRTVGTYQTVVAAAVCAGPVVLQLAGPGDPASFHVAAVLLALGALISLATPRHIPWAHEAASAGVSPVVWAVMVFASLTGIAEAVAVSVLPVQALTMLGMSVAAAAAIPGFSAAGNALVQYPIGLLAARAGVRRLLVGGTVVAAAAALAWPFVAGGLAGWPVMLLFGAGAGVFYTSATLLVTRAQLGGAAQARTLGMLNAGYLLGGALGAGVAGGVADALPGRLGLPLVLAAAIVAVAALGFAALRLAARRTPPTAANRMTRADDPVTQDR